MTRKMILKSLSFEFSSNVAGLWMAYWWFGNIGTCLAFTGVCMVVKIIMMLIHEWIWE
jgi:hypothetical protein